MKQSMQRIAVWILALVIAGVSFAQQSQTTKVFSKEQLEQMLAPIALYPDSLLAQVLMAATYPADVKSAAAVVQGQQSRRATPRSRRREKQGGTRPSVAGGVPAADAADGRAPGLGAEDRRCLPGARRAT